MAGLHAKLDRHSTGPELRAARPRAHRDKCEVAEPNQHEWLAIQR